NACGEDPHVDGIIEACCELIPSRPADKQLPALLRDVAAVASRLGMLDLNLLRLHGRLTAYSLNVHFDGALQQISAGEATAAFDFQPASVLSLRMVQDSISRKDRYIYAIEPNGGLANVGATEQLPFVRYQHLASRPIRDRLMQFSRWLASPVTNV
ncbi:MAG: hypothetical protein HYV60_04785, partial [Planctomycetia bacterium]|nr:hypothetical protein [Planctomycetia bacterium]